MVPWGCVQLYGVSQWKGWTGAHLFFSPRGAFINASFVRWRHPMWPPTFLLRSWTALARPAGLGTHLICACRPFSHLPVSLFSLFFRFFLTPFYQRVHSVMTWTAFWCTKKLWYPTYGPHGDGSNGFHLHFLDILLFYFFNKRRSPILILYYYINILLHYYIIMCSMY